MAFYFYLEKISKSVRRRCESGGIDRNVMAHFYSALLFLLFAFSVLYYSNFTYVWETRIFDEAGSRWCLKNARLGSSLFPSVSKSTGICNWNFRGSISLPRTNSNFTVVFTQRDDSAITSVAFFSNLLVHHYKKRRLSHEKRNILNKNIRVTYIVNKYFTDLFH